MVDGTEPTQAGGLSTVASTAPVAPIANPLAATVAGSSAGAIDDRGATLAAGTLAPGGQLDRSRRRYIVRRELARGGMGRISVADDTLLGRTVALKELLVPSGPLAARFGRELALSARLQHPAIVSIHDAGAWPNGEPFYVMKLVSGESLDRVIARAHTIGERVALLPTVIAMTDALAYAHAQHIIHRDLKPANVLVGEFGETVVIDWGLAKDLRAGEPAVHDDDPYRQHAGAGADGETLEGSVLGTPTYMPPEQAEGDLADERSDVYALGAVLYHVLAGAPPYTGRSSTEVLTAVLAGPPRPLGELADGVPPDLLAIVAKAMARAPADRYATAGDLAIDLKRFQSGQLVLAHRYSSAELVRRWLRKHRTAVAVASIAVVLLVGIAAVSFRRIVAEQHHTEAQRGLADTQRANAEELMSFMLVDLREKLEPIGKVEVLDAVARKARDYYDQRAAALTATDRYDRARALRNLGSVLLDQSHVAEATRELAPALVTALALTIEDPANAAYQREVALDHHVLGEVLYKAGATPAALANFRASLAITTRLAAAAPTDTLLARDLAADHRTLGQLLATGGDLDGALAESRASVALLEHIPGTEVQHALADSHDLVARALATQGHIDAALAEWRVGLAITERLVASDDANATWQRDLMVSHNNISSLLLARGDSAAGLAESRLGLAIAARQAASDPLNAMWKRDLGINHQTVGMTLLAQGDRDGALAEYRTALAINEALAADDRHDAATQRDLAITQAFVGNALVRTAPKEALEHFRAHLAIMEPLAASAPANADWQYDLIVGHMGVGDALDAANDPSAVVEYRACVVVAAALVARDPSSWFAKRNLEIAHGKVGSALVDAGDPRAGLDEFHAMLALATQLAAHDPASADYLRDVGIAHHRIAWGLETAKEFAAAIPEYQAAIAIQQQLVAKDPANASWRGAAAHMQDELAHCTALAAVATRH